MREEKKIITAEYVEWLKSSPYFIIVKFTGLTVAQFEELRHRLRDAKAELHVVKNTILKIAAEETGVSDLEGSLKGQLAVVFGEGEIPGAAKILKNFQSEFEKPQLRFGYLDNTRLEKADLETLAELPSMDVMRARLLGTIQGAAQKLVGTINEPATRIARVFKAYAEKSE
jgi:large subunit ribosomal protein L10